jgi:hypothetical protein
MSLTTAPMQSSFQSSIISEECYCAPWDLKIQEEKFKFLNKQHQIPLSFNNSNIKKPFHRTYSARKSSTKKSSTHRELSPPVLPPFPPGGLIPSCQFSTNNNNEKLNPQTIRSGADIQLMPFEVCIYVFKRDQKVHFSFLQTALLHFKHLNSSPYEQPWGKLQTSLNKNHRGRSLQTIPNTKQNCSSPTFPIISPCRHPNNSTTTPIDRYL